MSFRTDEEAPQFLWERTSYTRVSTSFLGLTWLNLRYEKEGTEWISKGNAWHQLTPRASSHETMHHGEEINSVAFYTASTKRLLIGSFFNALPLHAREQSTGLRSFLLTHPRPHYECYQSKDPWENPWWICWVFAKMCVFSNSSPEAAKRRGEMLVNDGSRMTHTARSEADVGMAAAGQAKVLFAHHTKPSTGRLPYR